MPFLFIVCPVSRHIAAVVGSYCLFTTHFNELGMLQKEVRTVVLSHVTALVSEEGITFQYQVRPGVSQQSFGVNVAKVAGLPLHAIEVCLQLFSSHLQQGIIQAKCRIIAAVS